MNGWTALDRFLHTDPRDVGCAEAMDMLHAYADLVAAGVQAERRYPGIAAHLQACGPCGEDFEGLLSVIAGEAPLPSFAVGPDGGHVGPAEVRHRAVPPANRPGEPQPIQGSSAVNDYPAAITAVNHVEPVPRRIRAFLAGERVLDTTEALYVWEWPYYPQYYIPLADVRRDLLMPEGHIQQSRRGTSEAHTLRVGQVEAHGAARLVTDSPVPGLAGTVRFDWPALDAWFEEDEQVFVHPRNPYVRVDALRSTRPVRVELDGLVLAESPAPVMVFETGLPTRYYINPTEINFDHLIPTGTVTSCPYKGTTSRYWSVRAGDTVHPDLAWAYDFPTRQLQPIAGLVAFYNEKVDLFLCGQRLERPKTHFFASADSPDTP